MKSDENQGEPSNRNIPRYTNKIVGGNVINKQIQQQQEEFDYI